MGRREALPSRLLPEKEPQARRPQTLSQRLNATVCPADRLGKAHSTTRKPRGWIPGLPGAPATGPSSGEASGRGAAQGSGGHTAPGRALEQAEIPRGTQQLGQVSSPSQKGSAHSHHPWPFRAYRPEGKTSKDAHQHLPNRSGGFLRTHFNSDRKPHPRGRQLRLSPRRDSCLVPRTLSPLLENLRPAMLGWAAPWGTGEKIGGWERWVRRQPSKATSISQPRQEVLGSGQTWTKVATEPASSLGSQVEGAPHRVPGLTRKPPCRDGAQGGDTRVLL